MRNIFLGKPSTLILLVVCAFAPRLLAQTSPPTATFSVVAGGSAPLSYQWRFSSTNDPAGPFEWIDPDTGHRVVQLSREPGSESLYFNLNPFTPDGKRMVFTSPSGISMIDLQTHAVEKIVEGRRLHVIMVGHKTGQIYYGSTNRTIFAVDPNTKVVRNIATLPRGQQVATVNADETLLGGTIVERTDWMAQQPVLDRGGFVGGVVVADQVQVQAGGSPRVDGLEELQELLLPVPAVVRGDDLPGGDVQGGEQAGRAIADIVVAAPRRGGGQDRQAGGRAVNRLNLRLLIHAQDQGVLGRVHVQADDVADLAGELRVRGQLPGLLQVRLQPERPPDP